MTIRRDHFKAFASVVEKHIDNYTVLQYGDAPNDQVQDWTPTQCMDCVKRYANRIESNRRGRVEVLRDMLKIAHFACLAFGKLQPTAEEIRRISAGD